MTREVSPELLNNMASFPFSPCPISPPRFNCWTSTVLREAHQTKKSQTLWCSLQGILHQGLTVLLVTKSMHAWWETLGYSLTCNFLTCYLRFGLQHPPWHPSTYLHLDHIQASTKSWKMRPQHLMFCHRTWKWKISWTDSVKAKHWTLLMPISWTLRNH